MTLKKRTEVIEDARMEKQVTLQAACGWYGITRQAHNQMRQRQAERIRIETVILTEVHRIRRDLPRLGGRKLLVKLVPFLEEEGLSIGRDRFFDLLRRHDLLVPVKRKPARTTFPGGVRSENLLASATIVRNDGKSPLNAEIRCPLKSG